MYHYPKDTKTNRNPQIAEKIMASYKAITYSEFDIKKVNFTKPRKANQGSVVNVRYMDKNLVLQTPLMSTFGLSRYEEKWSLCLSLYAYNQQAEAEMAKFRSCIDDIEEKIISDLVGGLYKEWLGVGDKWDKFSKDLIRELVMQKCEKKLLKHSKKDVDRKYAPTINIKLNRKKEEDGFYVNTFMLGDDNRIIVNEKGDCVEFDITEKLYFENTFGEEKKIRPKVYCLFSMSIWLINGNIFVTPVCNQVLIQPVKPMTMRVTFNEKGFCRYEDPLNGMEYEEEKTAGAASSSSSLSYDTNKGISKLKTEYLDFEEKDDGKNENEDGGEIYGGNDDEDNDDDEEMPARH